LRGNIKTLFENYSDIQYKPEKKKVIVKGNKALIENNIKYRAITINKDLKSLFYQGRERIYLKKDRNKWKIIAWVYEDK
ncbi:MAG: hypothetical protein KKH98_06845, partial [Spirochaetes bacterium]|nr:hypothetical protein [Spirochaetota bacterium]